jgi:hypothetical protein
MGAVLLAVVGIRSHETERVDRYMTEKYIIVKVRDADSAMPPSPVVVGGRVVLPTTPVSHIRRAIHKVTEDQFLSAADMVTHTRFMTREESDTVARVFEKAMRRAKGL